jgi:hypothetical protein
MTNKPTVQVNQARSRVRVNDAEMSYVTVGEGNAIVSYMEIPLPPISGVTSFRTLAISVSVSRQTSSGWGSRPVRQPRHIAL